MAADGETNASSGAIWWTRKMAADASHGAWFRRIAPHCAHRSSDVTAG